MGHPLGQDELSRLYSQGKSMMEIAELSSCSIHKVVYWMEKYGINRRNRSEATYVKLNPGGDPFHIKQNLTYEESFLLGLGLGIYWGEGNKVTPNSVRVTNTDPAVIKTFIRFLLEICGLTKTKLRYNIICFNDTDPDIARNYWASELEISGDKFGKITQIPKQGKGTYKRKSQFGVCTVLVGNIKLKRWIMQQLDWLKSPVSSTAERALGKG